VLHGIEIDRGFAVIGQIERNYVISDMPDGCAVFDVVFQGVQSAVSLKDVVFEIDVHSGLV